MKRALFSTSRVGFEWQQQDAFLLGFQLSRSCTDPTKPRCLPQCILCTFCFEQICSLLFRAVHRLANGRLRRPLKKCLSRLFGTSIPPLSFQVLIHPLLHHHTHPFRKYRTFHFAIFLRLGSQCFCTSLDQRASSPQFHCRCPNHLGSHLHRTIFFLNRSCWTFFFLKMSHHLLFQQNHFPRLQRCCSKLHPNLTLPQRSKYNAKMVPISNHWLFSLPVPTRILSV
mmetsp:Transcript_7884/g.11916  ORF Transcript_7884/g.11916 Transcript_7884/m.11916 type:complete len:226 (+) Transcript_7884:179-856(+)